MVKNGLAVGNTTSTKHVINSSGQWIGDPTGVIQDSYNTANAATALAQASYNQANTASSNTITLQSVNDGQNTTITFVSNVANSAYSQANTGTVLAQAAFDKANTPSTNSFSTIAVDGVSDELDANSPSSVLSFKGTSGIYMSVDKPNNTIGIATLGGMQGLNIDWGFVYEPAVAAIDFGAL